MNRWYFFDSLRMVLRNLAAARLRVWLTVAGIAFGTAALIAVLSIGQGGSKRVQMEMEDIGIRRIWLYPSEQAAAPFSYPEAQDLASQLEGQAYVGVAKEVRCTVSAGEISAEPVLIATQYTLPQMENLDFEQGRFFTEYEQEAPENVAVLEETLAKLLFPAEEQVVGKKVNIGTNAVTIVGVVKKRTTRSEDGMIYLSMDLYEHWYGDTPLDYISIVPVGERSVESVELLGKAALQSTTGVRVRSQTLRDEQEIADNVLNIFSWVIYSVAVVSLLVGGTGIMNVMFMSVQARTREIGIRKAIGATDRQIVIQFLQESVLLALAGGALGMGLGVFFSYLSCRMAELPFLLPWYAFAIALGFSFAIGVGFGVAPAVKAAAILPVQAFHVSE